jgi:hypothetical protein
VLFIAVSAVCCIWKLFIDERKIMKFVSARNNIFSLLMLCCLVFNAARVYAGQETSFRGDEREYVYALASEIEHMVDFFKASISSLIDPADHMPYKKLVMSMSAKVDEFESRVMRSLTLKLETAEQEDTPLFYKSLVIVSEILYEFMVKINEFRTILIRPEYLNAHDGVKAIKLGKELEKCCKDLLDGKLLARLECKLDQVYALVAEAGEEPLRVRLYEIKMLLKDLKSAFMQKRGGNNSELRIINGITAKIRHNK